ncbi:MAG TPA: CocE/NonD family hydrolase [Candidatus Acidoferrales bacterium]|nr:CocE/NonD family hydrolase [Candidatus Acidoferrales bacterium]
MIVLVVACSHRLPWTEARATIQFDKTDVMLPMRDGVRLHTAIFRPTNRSRPLPILLARTPYGAIDDPKVLWSNPNVQALAPDGYTFVYQDIRGRFGSEGQFVMFRRPASRPGGVDETTDAYDTIDWLVHHVPNNNGKVGMYGTSYGGWLTTMALLHPHPSLKAVSEQASPADQFLGDDFHHNGAFRLSYGFEYAAMLETSKTEDVHFEFDRNDTYEWYLDLGALSHVNERYFHGAMPTWNDFVQNPSYDAFWQKQAFAPYLKKTSVPNLNVAGWWDQEDRYGPEKIYQLAEPDDAKHWNDIVIGPWNHGGWNHWGGSRLGAIDFGQNTGDFFRSRVLAPWFRYWLRGEGQLPLSEALTFESGSNRWRRWAAWPPRQGVARRNLYFHAGGELSFDPPSGGGGQFDEYISDPAHPVPYRHRPISPTYPGGGWPTWLVQDQRFVEDRPDVQTWETGPLGEDVVVAGDIVARLFASTTGSDSDWIVKLIDVYPENYKPDPEMGGYELMIAGEVFRGRFRHSFDRPEPIVPGKVTEYRIDLHTSDHAFLAGHRIMVQVQSTWFPVIDRNPQTFVPNIFDATDSDYRKATQRIFRTPSAPSHIELPVVVSAHHQSPGSNGRSPASQ